MENDGRIKILLPRPSSQTPVTNPQQLEFCPSPPSLPSRWPSLAPWSLCSPSLPLPAAPLLLPRATSRATKAATDKATTAMVMEMAATAAAAGTPGPASGSQTVGTVTHWQNLWHLLMKPCCAANGVVHYGYNASFGSGFNNATQIRLAYRGCDGMSVSFATNSRQDQPQVKYGTSNTSLVSACLIARSVAERSSSFSPALPRHQCPSPTRPAPNGRTMYASP